MDVVAALDEALQHALRRLVRRVGGQLHALAGLQPHRQQLAGDALRLVPARVELAWRWPSGAATSV